MEPLQVCQNLLLGLLAYVGNEAGHHSLQPGIVIKR